jgi:hypothetical protein
MKALSLIQPYATLIMLGYKQYETRSWLTKHRGLLGIHASAGKPAWAREVCKTDPYIKSALDKHGLTFDTLPRGAMLGTCEVKQVLTIIAAGPILLGCCQPSALSAMERAAGDYTPGRYAWQLNNVQQLMPVPCKGALSLWEVPTEVKAQFRSVTAEQEGGAAE